jgi:hypothetical protein
MSRSERIDPRYTYIRKWPPGVVACSNMLAAPIGFAQQTFQTPEFPRSKLS